MSGGVGTIRWHLKKAARKGLAATAWGSGSLALHETMTAAPCVHVLTYHRVGNSRHDPFCVTRRDFEAQMRYLAEYGVALSLEHFDAWLAGETHLPAAAVLVTIDDGFRSLYTEMLPVLRHYAIPAVAYVSPGLITDPGGTDDAARGAVHLPEPYVNWKELSVWAESGLRIGSHGWSHRSLGRMGPVEMRDEAARSRDTLQARLGCRITSLAYPYGTRSDFSPTTANILAEVGYTTAFTSQHGAVGRTADPMGLPRVKIEGGEGLWMFRLLCRGATDAWRLVDRSLWRWQQAGKGRDEG
jgi:peptidoglycan/xylan/chitin deacetylase (PgdA/CDA1 family)